MGKTFSTGLLTNGLWQDASNNIGIGGSPSGTYKLEVTGTAKVSSTLLVGDDLTANGWLKPNGIYAFTADSGTTYIQQPTGGNMIFRKSDSTAFLTIANTGAATFSIGSGVYTAVNITSPNTSVYYKLTPTGGDSYFVGAGVNATNDFSIYNNTRSAAYLTITGGASGGNVGIGTSSPAYSLDVLSTNQYTARFNSSAAQGGFVAWANSGTAYGYVGNAYHIVGGGSVGDMAMAATANMVFSTGGSLTERMRITSGGEVLMNTTSVLSAGWLCISVASNNYNAIVCRDTGTTYSTGNYYQIFTNSSNGLAGGITHPTASTVGFYTGPSDQRLKSNIKDVEEPVLPLFNNAKLKTYNHIADEDESVVYKGFLAQDMVDNFPEAYGKDKDGYYMYNPTGYIPYLVKAIQELSSQNQDLKSRLDKAGL